MTMPDTAAPATTGHLCQDGCGQLASHVLVDLDDSSTQILATPCLIAMFAMIAMQSPGVLEGTGVDLPA